MADLNKEVWLSQLMEKFYPTNSFLNYVRDLSSLVENDKIHLAEAGIDPVVLYNNNTYPIAVTQRVDTPLEIELDKYETENTLVRRPEVIEYAYNQLESVLYGHRQALRVKTAAKAAHAIAPSANGAFTPVLEATGDVNDLGFKRLTFEDILRFKRRYDQLDIDTDKRYLVLNTYHSEDLMLQDLKTFKDVLTFRDGQPGRFAGFNMLDFTKPVYYDPITNTKKAFGAAIGSTDAYSSFAFHGDEIMKADGTVYMYSTVDDPKERGTIVGFDKRFICLPARNKTMGALISKKP